jgi:hypothetical protein
MMKPGSVALWLLIPLTLGSSCDLFGPGTSELQISTSGSGSGTATASPAADEDGYKNGTTVTITATAGTSSEFTGWDDADASVRHGCTQPRNPCTIVVDGRYGVVARFAPNAGAARFDGPYTGTVPTPNIGTGQIELTMANGVVSGKVTPLYGSLNSFSGTVSSTGAFTATVNPGQGSNCATSLNGTITISLVDGISTATMSGSWQVVSTGGVGCGAGSQGQPLPSGSWSATRDAIHVDKTIH